LGIYLVVLTQVLSIALAAILTGVVATAYTTQVQRRESFYEQQLREVLKDGIVTEEEKAHLKKMQADFGMSDEQVAAIADQIEEEKAQAAQKKQATQVPAAPQAAVIVEAPIVKERVTASDLSSLDPEEKLNLLASLVDSLSLRQKSSLLNRVADSLARHSIVVETVPPKTSGSEPAR
jgi:exopolysaccharide biosynthesis protein